MDAKVKLCVRQAPGTRRPAG